MFFLARKERFTATHVKNNRISWAAEPSEADRSAAAGKTIAPEAAAQPGAIGALQRREGRCSSTSRGNGAGC